MATSPNLGITLIETSQSQKEVTMNEAITILDAAIGGGVLDKDLSTPPVSPAAGDRYIVASSPTGAWAGKAKSVAYYYSGGWRFISPGNGMFMWVVDENTLYVYNGSAWAPATLNSGGSMFGINATADSTNRLSVNTDAILFNNNGAGVQCKLNKSAAGQTASFLFQSAFTGYAEIGLTGDNDFHFKVSDGSSWFESYSIDRTTGNFRPLKNIVLDGSTGTKIGTASSQKLGFLNATPVAQQTGGAATAGTTYTAAIEKVMLQKAYDCLRAFGLLS